MKKMFLVIFSVLAVAVMAYGGGYLEQDNGSQRIQTFAPNGKKDVALAITRATVNATGVAMWGVTTTASGCVYRLQSTATRAGAKHPVYASTWHVRAVNGATPYINFSGCTAGVLEVQ